MAKDLRAVETRQDIAGRQGIRFTPLEAAIVAWLVDHCGEPSISERLSRARPMSRDLTAVGSFLHIECGGASEDPAETIFDSTPIPGPDITCAGLSHGAGSVLFVTDGMPDTLEIFTYGGDALPADPGEFELSPPPSPS